MLQISGVKIDKSNKNKISVAIPHFNNSKMAHLGLFNILNDERISEIIFLDDCSKIEEFDQIKKSFAPYRKKVKLYRRNKNWGALANKIQAVSLCQNEWVILLDYDNTLLPEYLRSIFTIENRSQKVIYAPAYPFPFFDFREDMGGLEINLDKAKELARTDKFNEPFFNDGNYFVHKNTFVDTLKPYLQCNVSAADVVFANYAWLSSGNSIHVLKDSKYYHRAHAASTWLNNKTSSMQISDKILQNLKLGYSILDVQNSMLSTISKKDIDWEDNQPVLIP